MPRKKASKPIKTSKQVVNGQSFIAKFEFDVAQREFFVNLPAWINEVTKDALVSSPTLDGCEAELEKALLEYKRASTKVKKVIRYEFQLQGSFMSPDGERCLASPSDIHFCDGLGVAVAAWVCEEREIESGGKTTYSYKELEWEQRDEHLLNKIGQTARDVGRYGVRAKCMEWTKEREEFFIRIVQGITKVALMLRDLKSDGEKLQAIADSGNFNLLGSGSHGEPTEPVGEDAEGTAAD